MGLILRELPEFPANCAAMSRPAILSRPEEERLMRAFGYRRRRMKIVVSAVAA
jgi:hypothetical protein